MLPGIDGAVVMGPFTFNALRLIVGSVLNIPMQIFKEKYLLPVRDIDSKPLQDFGLPSNPSNYRSISQNSHFSFDSSSDYMFKLRDLANLWFAEIGMTVIGLLMLGTILCHRNLSTRM
jgi:hypothetical protein